MPFVATAPAASPDARGSRIRLLLLLLGAFALRVVALDRLGLAYDEAASALMARATPQEIVAFHWNAAFEHPPVWALLLHGWSLLAGQSEFALRLLPAYAGTLMVAMTWQLVRTIWPCDTLLAWLGALFTAFSPVLIYYSQEARMYTLVVLLLLVATYLVLRLRQQPRLWLVIAFWLASWFMLGLHYYAALALAIQAGVLAVEGVWAGPSRRVPWLTLFAAFAGALLPVALWMLFSPGFQTTLEVVLDRAGENPVTWHYFLGDLWRELTFGSIRWQPPYATWGYALAPLVLVGALLMVARRGQPAMARLGAWLVVALVLLPILSATLALRTLVPRYILWVVPLFCTLAALPAAMAWRRHWAAGMSLVLLVMGLNVLALHYYFGPYRKSDYRAMTTYLQAHGAPQREILLLEAPRQHLLTKYYMPAEWQYFPMPTLALPAYWPVTAPLLVPEEEDDRIQRWLVDHAGLWVSYTSEAEVDRGEFLAKYLTAVSFREQCTQWLDVRLCHYVSPHHLEPRSLDLTPMLFGNALALEGAQVSFYSPTPTTMALLIQLNWRAAQKPDTDYKVALKLLDSEGQVRDEADDYPIGALLPPTTWNAGDRKPGYFVLHLPDGEAAASYRIQLGLYDANTLTPAAYTPTDRPAEAAVTESLILVEALVGDTMELRSPVAP